MPIYYPPLAPGQSYAPQHWYDALPQIADVFTKAMLMRQERERERAQTYLQLTGKLASMNPEEAAAWAQEVAKDPKLATLIGKEGMAAFKKRVAEMPRETVATPPEGLPTPPPGQLAMRRTTEEKPLWRGRTSGERREERKGELELENVGLAMDELRQRIAAGGLDIRATYAKLAHSTTMPDGTRVTGKQLQDNPDLVSSLVPIPALKQQLADIEATSGVKLTPQEIADFALMPVTEQKMQLENRRNEGLAIKARIKSEEAQLALYELQREILMRENDPNAPGPALTPSEELARDKYVTDLNNDLGKLISTTTTGLQVAIPGQPGWVSNAAGALFAKLTGTETDRIMRKGAAEGGKFAQASRFDSLWFGKADDASVLTDMKAAGIDANKIKVYKMVPEDESDPANKRMVMSKKPITRDELVGELVKGRKQLMSVGANMIALYRHSPARFRLILASRPGLINLVRDQYPELAAEWEALIAAPQASEEQTNPYPQATKFGKKYGLLRGDSQ